ncbi:hypothetical protein [Streptomyces albidoflavus]|uniref:hypothetical protein n=1 Tax=Streptomyces albidoflavus TaxID=1886 RepID=UPI0033269CDA
MAFQTTTLPVLIASPGGTTSERKAVEEAILSWNSGSRSAPPTSTGSGTTRSRPSLAPPTSSSTRLAPDPTPDTRTPSARPWTPTPLLTGLDRRDLDELTTEVRDRPDALPPKERPRHRKMTTENIIWAGVLDQCGLSRSLIAYLFRVGENQIRALIK